MMMTSTERRVYCDKHFWMKGVWLVVVKCQECGRQLEAEVPAVIGLDGKLKLAYCESCEAMSCSPMLKDHETVAYHVINTAAAAPSKPMPEISIVKLESKWMSIGPFTKLYAKGHECLVELPSGTYAWDAKKAILTNLTKEKDHER